QNENGKGWEIKYYKDLAAHTHEEMRKYLSNIKIYVKQFKAIDEEDSKLIKMAFAKENINERRNWIENIEDGAFIDYKQNEISIKDFINKELSLSFIHINLRSIPSVIDGLKSTQRKVLFSCFKRNLVTQIMVPELSGYVSENTKYHHGATNIDTIIIGLAQNFTGSNNINLLEPIGHFGNRNNGIKGAASARIGVGWSTNIPNFNPKDIIQNLKRKIKGEMMIPMQPWYHGFCGEIKPIANAIGGYKSFGIITRSGDTSTIVSELPVHKWTNEYVASLRKSHYISNIENHCTDKRVCLNIETSGKRKLNQMEDKGLDKSFKLTTTLATSNMVCININNKFVKYVTSLDIINEFYHKRLEYYVKRKEYLIKNLQKKIDKIENQLKFIYMRLGAMLKFEELNEEEIVKLLKYHNFTKIYDDWIKLEEEGLSKNNSTSETNQNIKGYNYLMKLTCWAFTKKEVIRHENKKKMLLLKLDTISSMSPQDIWTKDLDELEVEWIKFINNDQENIPSLSYTTTTTNSETSGSFLMDSNKLNHIDINDNNRLNY
ncbi:13917_t:CDS:2, partial [Entrophospora sp. SA101]